MREARKQLAEKEDTITILKKVRGYTFNTLEEKYQFIKADKSGVSKEKLCREPEVSRSAYYHWLKRPLCERKLKDQAILRDLVRLHQKWPFMGLDSLHQLVRKTHGCSRGRVHRLMKQARIQSCRKRAYRCTANSKHDNPIDKNLLMRNFACEKPNTIWVGDITYVPTGEGWLYVAIVKDLCTKKVVGYAFGNRIDSALTIAALKMAIRRQPPPGGLHFPLRQGRSVHFKSISQSYCRTRNCSKYVTQGRPLRQRCC